jgi:hypothetical protein
MSYRGMAVYIEEDSAGWAGCPFCWGKGHLIGIATTTAADCRPCGGTGQVYFRRTITRCPHPLTPQCDAAGQGS